MLSPASLYLLTVVACTRSWSQMAALWRTIHRRTGETTVRISMAIQQIRNWVRKPMFTGCVSVSVCVTPFCLNRDLNVFWYSACSLHRASSSLLGTECDVLDFQLVLAVGPQVIWVPARLLKTHRRLLCCSRHPAPYSSLITAKSSDAQQYLPSFNPNSFSSQRFVVWKRFPPRIQPEQKVRGIPHLSLRQLLFGLCQ